MGRKRKATIEFPEDLYIQLSHTAKRRRVSVAQLVRDACDAQYSTVTRKQRLEAVRKLGRLNLPVGPVEEMIRESVPDPAELLP